MRESTFSQNNYRYKKGERTNERAKLFNRHRKIAELMQQQGKKEQFKAECMQSLDYHTFYSPEVREVINKSLQMAIPAQLPPLTLHTISLYRRAGRQVFLTRKVGSERLQPHLVYESLMMLAYCEKKGFAKYQGVVKQFQREMREYMGMGWGSVREMVVVAAGNKAVGREEDIMQLVSTLKSQALWVLINHVYEHKISSRHLLPFLLAGEQIAFLAFSELTLQLRDESVTVLAESDEAIDCLVGAMQKPGQLGVLALKIISNLLGENQEYWRLFHGSQVLERGLELLLVGSEEVRALVLTMLFNFVFEPGAATAVLRFKALSGQLVEMLRSGQVQWKRGLLGIFSFLVYKAQKQEAFRELVSVELLEICEEAIGGGQDVDVGALQLVCGLVELGAQFPNEEGENVVAQMINNNMGLVNKITQLSLREGNNEICLLCFAILDLLPSNEIL